MSPRVDLKSDDPACEREQDSRDDCETHGLLSLRKMTWLFAGPFGTVKPVVSICRIVRSNIHARLIAWGG
jgi:hypothetical protein